MPAAPPPAREPLTGHAPAAGAPPRGPLARLRTRIAVARSRGRVSADRGVTLGPGVRFDVAPSARVHLGAHAAIGGGSRLHVTGGELRVGADATLGEGCVVQSRTAVTIGAGAALADEVVVLDHRPIAGDVERPVRRQGTTATPIVVGPRVRIGPRTVVGGGAVIGEGAQIAAQLVIDASVPAGGRVTASVPRVR